MGKHTTKHDSEHDANGDAEEQQPQFDAIDLSDAAADLVAQLEAERDEAIASHKRALADFQNFQRRSIENERRAGEQGVSRVVRSILPVLDHFDLALGQKQEGLTVEQLKGGVKIVRDELSKTLQLNGVERIEPNPGDEFDPTQHEAMMRQPAEGIKPNHIVMVMQPGYRIGDHVLRPAKVAIAPSEED